jgi:cysteinyl-tRNA synthetase
MLQLRGEKMSKSLGNLVTVDEFLAAHEPDAFRLMVLNSHYRGPLSYSDEIVAQAEAALERLRGGLRPARPKSGAAASPGAAEALSQEGTAARERFIAALEDDFNTPAGLAAIFDLVRAINQARDAGVTAEMLEGTQEVLRELTGVLGLGLQRRTADGGEGDAFIQLLVEVRERMRQAKQWDAADFIRDRLADLGVILEDSGTGTHWERR